MEVRPQGPRNPYHRSPYFPGLPLSSTFLSNLWQSQPPANDSACVISDPISNTQQILRHFQRNNCIFLISSDCKQLQCPHELSSDLHTKGLAWLLQAFRGSGSFNLLHVQGEGRARFSLINKEKIQSLLN